NTEAAKSIRYGGLSDDEALSLVTINPARQLRIDNRVGSLEVGKDADVVVWSHHPLSSYAIAERVYIDGVKYYDRLDDQKRLTDPAREKQPLADADRGERRAPSTTEASTPRALRAERGGPSDNGDAARPFQGRDRGIESPALRRPSTKGILAITNAR